MYPMHHVKRESGAESLTVFLPDGPPIVVNNEHPQFEAILTGTRSGEADAEELRNLADLSGAVAQRFDQLSERVSVADGHVYFDGDKVDSTITQQIIRCLEDPDAGDWKPLVLFMENVAANPNEHSREQLFDWLRDREFTITSDGCFIAFKGVSGRDADDGYPYQSCSTGSAIVNGERYTGNIPNGVGATVEMPRGDVQHNPAAGCSTGLHVGTHKYAEGYARAALLTVHVNPRDVVSVPTDCNAEKMRVCRYRVQDDDPTPPEEAAAIDYGEEVDEAPEPLEVYLLTSDNCGYPERLGDYVKTGEVRQPREGEVYLADGDAIIAHFSEYSESFPILTKLYASPAWDSSDTEFYVKTGEERPPKAGEYYLWAEGNPGERVCVATIDVGPEWVLPILIPAEEVESAEEVFTHLLSEGDYYDGHTEFVATGEVRGAREGEFYTPAEGATYAGQVCRAAYDHDSAARERILTPKD